MLKKLLQSRQCELFVHQKINDVLYSNCLPLFAGQNKNLKRHSSLQKIPPEINICVK